MYATGKVRRLVAPFGRAFWWSMALALLDTRRARGTPQRAPKSAGRAANESQATAQPAEPEISPMRVVTSDARESSSPASISEISRCLRRSRLLKERHEKAAALGRKGTKVSFIAGDGPYHHYLREAVEFI